MRKGMRIIIIGAAGFIGTNIIIRLSQNRDNEIFAYDEKIEFFNSAVKSLPNVHCGVLHFTSNPNFDSVVSEADLVFHLASTTIPATSNEHITQEITSNILPTSLLLEACVKQKVGMVFFISSGGTVYGNNVECPIKENSVTYPITSYGLQKVTIEKLLYLYHYIYGLNYRIIRLANPYGPYQRPNGLLGAVTTFTYKALCCQPITVFGDGSVIRDYIYIDDVINAIENIINKSAKYRIYNIGSGIGTSVNELILTIEETLNTKILVNYIKSRKNDVPKNCLDVHLYEREFGKLSTVDLKEGILKTADFMLMNNMI